MAIAEMSRLSVLLMRPEQERLTRLLQRFGCMQFTQVDQMEGRLQLSISSELAGIDEDITRIRWAITKLTRYDKVKQSMFLPLPEVSRNELEAEEDSLVMDFVRQTEDLERKAGELHGEETRLSMQMAGLQPWLQLDIPADQLKDTPATRVFAGSASSRGLSELAETWKGRRAVLYLLGTLRDSAFFAAFVHRSQAEEFLQAIRTIGFQQSLPESGSFTAHEAHQAILTALSDMGKAVLEVDESLSALSVNLPRLRVAYESLMARKARLKAQEQMAHTASSTLMSGWVPAYIVPALKGSIEAEFPTAMFEVSDPEEGEEPPVLLCNSAIVRPYEAVVSGFALPAHGAIDPSAVMMPFFACFFGMMVSDAGYGLMMAILIPIMVKLMKPSEGGKKIFWILAGGGISTLLWGVLYNTWFGFAPFPSVFDPINNSLPVMAVCIGIGALHLFAGLILGMVQNFRKGQPLDALYDQFSWALLVVGLGLLLLPQAAAIGKWMAITGTGIVLLTAGRNKTKNPFKRLLSGLGALYGVTSWISDLLSYMRLFGMGLATGVIGMVINQLVGMIMGSGIIGIILGSIIFVGAHLFNAAINILGAYVHACRLQYIEFFGKFYQEGGKSFNPLRFSPRYVRVNDSHS